MSNHHNAALRALAGGFVLSLAGAAMGGIDLSSSAGWAAPGQVELGSGAGVTPDASGAPASAAGLELDGVAGFGGQAGGSLPTGYGDGAVAVSLGSGGRDSIAPAGGLIVDRVVPAPGGAAALALASLAAASRRRR